jgi:ATP-dependent RNA helicase SUPV3L1/SUV3
MEEARKFEDGQTDCLVATDAIAIGQNYNIERIIFRDITKFINRKEIRLDSQTVKQVAGRAGRYGRFPVGYVNTWRAQDREEIRLKLQEEDVPSRTAPLELPAFLVEKELPLSLIYRAWTSSEAGEPFVKADTTTELFICRLIESEYPSISKQTEYNLASLPLDLRDRAQLDLLRRLFAAMLVPTSDEEWKAILPDPGAIR